MSMETGTTWMRLAGMAACGFVLLVTSELYRKSTAPLRQRETEALRDAKELGERIGDAHGRIAEVLGREEDLVRIRGEIDRVQADIPPGSANVAFPAWVKDRFAGSALGVPSVRLEAAQDEPNAPAYVRGFWSVALPIDEAGRNVPKLLAAVADMDWRNSFLRILDFEIGADPAHPGGRVAVLHLATVLRK